MKNRWLFTLITIFSFYMTLPDSYASTIDTLVVYINGEQASVQTVQEGVVNLYSTLSQKEVVKEIQGGFYNTEIIEIKHYFIGNSIVVEEIVPNNYKKLIIKYLPNAPYLHKKLGKLGFRYENIPQMIEFYNKFRASKEENEMAHSM